MTPGRRADALCILGLFALGTLLFADVLFLGSNFYFRDLYVYPKRFEVLENPRRTTICASRSRVTPSAVGPEGVVRDGDLVKSSSARTDLTRSSSRTWQLV